MKSGRQRVRPLVPAASVHVQTAVLVRARVGLTTLTDLRIAACDVMIILEGLGEEPRSRANFQVTYAIHLWAFHTSPLVHETKNSCYIYFVFETVNTGVCFSYFKGPFLMLSTPCVSWKGLYKSIQARCCWRHCKRSRLWRLLKTEPIYDFCVLNPELWRHRRTVLPLILLLCVPAVSLVV